MLLLSEVRAQETIGDVPAIIIGVIGYLVARATGKARLPSDLLRHHGTRARRRRRAGEGRTRRALITCPSAPLALRRSERVVGPVVVQPVRGPLAGVRLVVGPVRLLLRLVPVQHRPAADQVADRGDQRRRRCRAGPVPMLRDLVAQRARGCCRRPPAAGTAGCTERRRRRWRGWRRAPPDRCRWRRRRRAWPGPRRSRARRSCTPRIGRTTRRARNRATPAATAVKSVWSSNTMKPAHPSPLPMDLHRLVRERRVELVAGDERVGDART